MRKKAIIAMSGGVDSSVAACLMKEQGFECIGATMKLFQNEEVGVPKEHTCCSLDDIEDARSVANALDMPHYVMNFSEKFEEKVISKFVEAYENGRTPNPCIDCNRYLKFEKLYLRAKELGFDYVVTGHYARIEQDSKTGRYLLKKAVDPTKDQSYVLYALTQEQLAFTMFPLGIYEKKQVRALADRYGFVNAEKPDSQDICFVQNGNYADFITQYTKKDYPKGDFIATDGTVLGKHQGIIRYTIGQRKGLGIAFSKPMFVCDINPEQNTVMLGDHNDLFTSTLTVKDVNLISVPEIAQPTKYKVKVRYRQQEEPAMVEQLDADTLKITFDTPQRAITKGQAAVIYDGDIVVGGGVIS